MRRSSGLSQISTDTLHTDYVSHLFMLETCTLCRNYYFSQGTESYAGVDCHKDARTAGLVSTARQNKGVRLDRRHSY